MKPSNLKESVKAGLARSYFDGVTKWSRKTVEGVINPAGYRNFIDDPEIITMFKEIEQEGVIKIIGNDDVYLEIKK